MEKPKQMLSVFMPARDEEQYVGKNLEVLKDGIQKGKIDHAVIVIDGSKDKTPEIVFQSLGLTPEQVQKLTAKKRGTLILPNGFILIYHNKPQGKGRSFIESVFSLKGRTNHFRNPDSVLVNIDADALDLELKTITGMAKEITKRNVPLLLGVAVESSKHRNSFDPAFANAIGFRAMKSKALEPLIKMNPDWMRTFPKRFGMDHALNILIRYKRQGLLPPHTSEIQLIHAPPGKHESDLAQIHQRSEVSARHLKQTHKLAPDNLERLAFHERKGIAPKRRNRPK